MRKSTMHVLLTASILIFSSLAGCLGTADEEDEASKGTVIVSTYHVEQIVSAIAGDTLNVEILAPSNVPVHDYEPSAADLIRLQGADMFFYHGLGLETWIDATMDSLGDDAPASFSTHAMPTGQTALDYEGMLVDQLCKSLSAPGTTDVHILAESMYFADEIHSDNAAHNLAMPEDDHHDDHDDHDDHGDEDHDDHDDHDDHGDDDHDDHGDHGDDDHDDHDDHGDHDDHDHGDHDMVEAEETLTASSDCPTDTTISVYELEAGEYMLEFEAEDMETFSIAIAAMGGAHHHHHDHGDEHNDDHGDEHDDDHDDHGDDQEGHDDHWESDVCHDMDTHENHDEYTTEEDCEAAGHMWMEGEHEMDADEMIEMFDTDSDGLLSLSEFLTMAEEMEDDEHDHDDDHNHSDDGSADDSGDDHDEHNPAHEIEMAMFEIIFHMADMNEDENLNGDELDRLIDAMEGDLPIDGEEMAEIYFDVFDEDENDLLTLDEFSEMMEMMMSEEDDHDDHDHGENETHDEDHDDDMTEMMFAMYDADEDGNISMEEFSEVMEMMGDEHEEGVAFIGFHVEEEGDYGFALPAGVELHILSMGGHEGHDHGAHDDHDDHDDHGDEDTHDDHGDEEGHDDHGDEEALAYDPHSWLDPLAYKAQVALVLGEMKTVFPDLADTFQTNADAFMASLDEVDADYNAAFGPNGTCTNNTVAANHNAYSYIAYRYNLEFVTVHGLDPEGEPSAADIAEVVEKIEEDAITVLYIEEYTDETAVNSIVDQTNGAVTVQILYTMELPPKDSSDDYLSLMEKNLNSLKAGLGC
jgi:ABC-type Zn uptake system ZnuABC Zn-binding protein ZnuA/Ca2+-binding EF-hand superfamily protein